MDNIRNKLKAKLESIPIVKIDSDEHEKFVEDLSNIFPESLPPLFRYRSCNKKSISAFRGDRIFLVLPELFNDPYDCLPFVNYKNIDEIFNFAKSKDSLQNFVARVNSGQDPFLSNFYKSILGEEYDFFIKNLSLSEKEAEEFIQDNKKEISDNYEEIREYITKFLTYINSLCYIACFSEINDSTLMWSHYADSHKGFVLKYDLLQVDEEDKGLLFPIIYDRSRCDITLFISYIFGRKFLGEPNPFNLIKSQLYKSKDWKYEKEWRMINLRKSDNQSKLISIKCKPKAIYYGAKISAEHKNQLHEIAVKKGIDEYQAQLDYFSPNYKMSFKKL